MFVSGLPLEIACTVENLHDFIAGLFEKSASGLVVSFVDNNNKRNRFACQTVNHGIAGVIAPKH